MFEFILCYILLYISVPTKPKKKKELEMPDIMQCINWLRCHPGIVFDIVDS